MTRLTIDPITRLEGHGKIEIFLDDAGDVQHTYFQVPELRGFEQFCVGRPVEEMPVLVNRICGVCPEAHHMAAAKAADAVYGVDPPRPAKLLRELLYSAFYVADHTTHFYALSGPDFIMGPDAPVAERNLLGVLQKVGSDVGGRVIETRRRCHRVVEIIGGRAIHPATSVPGGLTKHISAEERDEIEATAVRMVDFGLFSLGLFDELVLGNPGYVEMITGPAYRHETYSMGLVDAAGKVNFYDGKVRIVGPDGALHARIPAGGLPGVDRRARRAVDVPEVSLPQEGRLGGLHGRQRLGRLQRHAAGPPQRCRWHGNPEGPGGLRAVLRHAGAVERRQEADGPRPTGHALGPPDRAALRGRADGGAGS